MKRKQIYIEEGQEERLKRLAATRGLPEAALIREAVAEYLTAQEAPQFESMEDTPLWNIVGIATGPGPIDGSLNHDHYIYGVPKKYRITRTGKVVRNKLP